ncbi:hypothetical protein HNP84_006355 [Thermocatellispora tengchongensis]|uniref:FtsX extracellular domain-containing protein n=1 Tax=Thermocatellispora tengchongensis TaxID=1073253 RepID=A0A840P5L4_9ACTN|nr:permease-like cell division protein FtsX [Thermocatellispora tengchongensis]MBB5136604.1 hypothetical protein [Thermocatellispora tengchongensis]
MIALLRSGQVAAALLLAVVPGVTGCSAGPPGATSVSVTASAPQTPSTPAATGPAGADHIDISVFLCQKDDPFESCEGKPATARQKREIEALLRRHPDVVEATFEDKRAAYENFREQYGEDSVLVSAMKVDDMPESWRVSLPPGTDATELVETVRRLPGVSDVIGRECVSGKCRRVGG